MQFAALRDMVDSFKADGVDIRDPFNKDPELGWVESPAKLFKKHRVGEISFWRETQTGRLAMDAKRTRIIMRTEDQFLLELYRIYPGGHRVEQFPHNEASAAAFMQKSGWSVSETGLPFETEKQTGVRGILQELGLEIPESYLQPLKHGPVGNQFEFSSDYHMPLQDIHPSTIYPLTSRVNISWFEWVLNRMPSLEFGLMRNDEDVEIYRELRPW